MPDAGHGLDPIETARHGLERSREVLRSAAGDLDAHRRWFKSYVAEEEKKRKQHTRRVKHHQAMLRRRERREQAIRSAKRTAIFSAIAVRSKYRFASHAAASALASGSGLLSRASARITATARIAASHIHAHVAHGLGLGRTKARALRGAGITAISALAAQSAEKARNTAAVARMPIARAFTSGMTRARAVHPLIGSEASRLQQRARALARTASAAALAGVSAARVHFASFNGSLRLVRSSLRANGRAMATSLQNAVAHASAWGAANMRDLEPKLAGAASRASASTRRAAEGLTLAVATRISVMQPRLRAYARRAAALVESLPGQARHGLDRVQQGMLVPAEHLAASAIGAIRRQSRRLAVRVRREASVGEPRAAARREDRGDERGTALACIGPWRANLPAVRPAETGRQSPAF